MHDWKNIAHWKGVKKPKLGHWTNQNLRCKGKMNNFEVTLQDVPYTPHLTCILRCRWCFTLFSCYNLNKLPKKRTTMHMCLALRINVAKLRQKCT